MYYVCCCLKVQTATKMNKIVSLSDNFGVEKLTFNSERLKIWIIFWCIWGGSVMKNFNFVTSSSKDIKIKSEKEAERGGLEMC